jgi:thiamine pyrophosphokinase
MTLYRAAGPVTLVGAGPVAPSQLEAALELAPEAVAADGGGNLALPGGHAFRAVIGDMDSLADPVALRAAGAALHPILEQDSTDLEKCLRSIEAPLIIGLGFLGGRIDHHLAAMNALVKHPGPVVLVGGDDLCFVCPPELSLDLAPGTRVSLFPMGPVQGGSEGLRWPVHGIVFGPDARIGTSNVALGPVRLAFDAPRMLVILPETQLGQVAERLASGVSSPRPPARPSR